jgi:glycosyltransferase involved in cell wall biosynthesis
MRIVGTNTLGYAQLRNFAGCPLQGYQVRKFQDVNKLRLWMTQKLTGRIVDRHLNTFAPNFLSRCDLFHFFNALSTGRQPWVTTFETSLPRWGAVDEGKLRQGFALMAGPACRRLIALSQHAAHLHRAYVAEHAPDLGELLMAKETVLHPPQAVLVEDVAGKPDSDKEVVFIFVGRAFFQKGGGELLEAFSHIHQAGFRNWRLEVVSGLEYGDYATLTGAGDLARAQAIIRRYPAHIRHHPSLSNREVLDLFRTGHVGLLPTWDDTYGYSVLESQAAGCPVISTDIRALPEINSDATGWLLEVPKNAQGKALRHNADQRKVLRKALRDQLVTTLEGILRDPATIAGRAAAAIGRIRREHSPEAHARILERIYDKALADRPGTGGAPYPPIPAPRRSQKTDGPGMGQ